MIQFSVTSHSHRGHAIPKQELEEPDEMKQIQIRVIVKGLSLMRLYYPLALHLYEQLFHFYLRLLPAGG